MFCLTNRSIYTEKTRQQFWGKNTLEKDYLILWIEVSFYFTNISPKDLPKLIKPTAQEGSFQYFFYKSGNIIFFSIRKISWCSPHFLLLTIPNNSYFYCCIHCYRFLKCQCTLFFSFLMNNYSCLSFFFLSSWIFLFLILFSQHWKLFSIFCRWNIVLLTSFHGFLRRRGNTAYLIHDMKRHLFKLGQIHIVKNMSKKTSMVFHMFLFH